jgi:hypothetical protein
VPFTAKQRRFFQAAAHSKKFAKAVGLSQAAAKRLAKEAAGKRTKRPVKRRKAR